MKIINNMVSLAFVLFGFYLFFTRMNYMNLGDILLTLSPILIVLVPFLLKKLFKLEIGEGLHFTYLVFVFLALFLGSFYGFYDLVPGFDKFVHFLSGILSAMIGIIILKQLNAVKENKILFNILFVIFFAVFIAVMWEFFEFTSDKLFQRDAQKVVKTGVDDTMLDMLSATIGSSIYSIIYYIIPNKKKH